MNIILLGPPGSGKGSQAEKLTVRYGILHISTGDIFRDNLKRSTPLGLLAKSFMDKGELVPDEVTNDIVKNRLLDNDVKKGFMLDGYPRNVFQAETLTINLADNNTRIDAVINITSSEDIIIKRITGRRVCPKCQMVYHIDNKKPRVEGICDVCGSKLIQRADDTYDVIKNRLEIYEAQTSPVLDYYLRVSPEIVLTVDGNTGIEAVYEVITKHLG